MLNQDPTSEALRALLLEPYNTRLHMMRKLHAYMRSTHASPLELTQDSQADRLQSALLVCQRFDACTLAVGDDGYVLDDGLSTSLGIRCTDSGDMPKILTLMLQHKNYRVERMQRSRPVRVCCAHCLRNAPRAGVHGESGPAVQSAADQACCHLGSHGCPWPRQSG
jgi:hypothetical protein